jgi:glycosyltransferase involved in cell wall biosynthesis
MLAQALPAIINCILPGNLMKGLATTPTKLSAVAPCYNEAAVLVEFHRRMSAACASLTDDYEIVLVNDGSSDDSWPVLLSLAEQDPHVVAINLSRNHGQPLALTAGLAYCRGERILIIDVDLQDPPELLSEMMALCDRGADIVYGKRRSRAGESIFKRLTAFLFYRVLNLFTDQHIPEDTGDFRLIARRVLDVLNSMPENHRFIRGMISWVGFKQVAFLYDRSPRFAGKTKYALRKMLHFALDAITSFSVRPLRLAFYAGGILCMVSILLLVFSIGAYFVDRTIRGWTSIMAVMLFFLAAQFLVLGLIGEYVGRLYIEAKHRPLFIVEDVVACGRPVSPLAAPDSEIQAGYER